MNTPERKYGDEVVQYNRGVSLSNVSFRYPAADSWAVHGVSLQIRPGETVAIVGENGAGKTTLVRLMAGMYLPQKGDVTFGDTHIEDGSADSVYKGLSTVFQRYQRYRMTVEDNVTLGEIERVDNGVEGVLEQAGFIMQDQRLPNGVHTMLSKEFGGTDLSGGEWQRLAIARGLYRTHDLIILDEPTASIDPIEETRVYEKFIEAAAGKTAILVTHRLGSARIADRIIVMENGEIIEEGAHETLLSSNGSYARMFKTQAKWYQRGFD